MREPLRAARKGSWWRDKQTGEYVRVIWKRGATGTHHNGMVAFCTADGKRGNIRHEEDFRNEYEWMSGR